MVLPKMILFDYGQTLVNEQKFDGVRGVEAVLAHATKNKYNRTAAEVQAVADSINKELGRFDPKQKHLFQIEVPNHMFTSYLYESQGIEIPLTPKEIDRIFWDAASPGTVSDGIEEFLRFLRAQGIRTGVISNICYDSELVKKRITTLISGHDFEFILATSEYMFRKPNCRIFELALEKADLRPEDVWYIGDNYQCDVVGARGAGIFPVWYLGATDRSHSEKADALCAETRDVLTVQNWKELELIMRDQVGCRSGNL